MTPSLSLQYQSNAALLDKKGRKSEGRIDPSDSVEIQGPFNIERSIPVKEFLTDSAYDGFGSPQARLEMLKSGGGSCMPRSIFFNPFQAKAKQLTCQNSTVSGTFRSTKWADEVVDTAQADYEKRLRKDFAAETFPFASKVTEALRDALVQDPSLREDHLVSKLSESTLGPADSMEFALKSARAFLKDNPKWTMEDLAEINRAMGNSTVAYQLERAANGHPNYAHLNIRPETAVIYLPTGKAADILKE